MQSNKILSLILLFGTTSNLVKGAATRISSRAQRFQNQFMAEMQAEAQATITHSCGYAIARTKAGASFDYESIVAAGSAWTDTTFTTDDYLYWSDYTSGSLSSFYTSSYKRAMSDLPSPIIYGSESFYADIDQGQLGDCYYLSACAEIGESSSRMEKVFLTDEINSAGIFAASVYIKGIPTVVVVDDRLPYNTTYNWLDFAQQASSGAVWGPLMEKVWAKVAGNYEYIIGGTSKEAFDSLLGSPGLSYTMTGTAIGYSSTDSSTIATAKAAAWSLIYAYDQDNYLLGCSVGTSNNYGLVDSHAYSLMGAYTITNSSNVVTNKLYKIRNPWGTDVYSGNWNDTDTTRWTASAQAQVGFVNNTSDGIFWIEDVDFVQAFSSFVVSFYTDAYYSSYYEVLSDTQGTTSYFTFTTTQTNDMYVGFEFYAQRMYAYGCKNGTSSSGTMIIYTSGGTQLSSQTVYDSYGFNYIEYPTLSAGTYVMSLTMTYWGANDTTDYTARTYGAQAVTITQLSTVAVTAFKLTALTTALTNGYASNSPSYSNTYTYYKAYSGFQGAIAYLEFQPVVTTCKKLLFTIYIYSATSAPSTSTGTTCLSLGSNSYSCSCDLSKTGYSKCQYAYYATTSSYKASYSYSC